MEVILLAGDVLEVNQEVILLLMGVLEVKLYLKLCMLFILNYCRLNYWLFELFASGTMCSSSNDQ